MTPLTVVWERADGWPRRAAGAWLTLSLLCGCCAFLWGNVLDRHALQPGWLSLCGLSGSIALILSCWRRTLRIAEGALWQGWGFRLPLRAAVLRMRESSISLPPLEAIWVEERREHFKSWSQMYAVVVGVPRSLQRAVLDDEFVDRGAAERMAGWLSKSLCVPEASA